MAHGGWRTRMATAIQHQHGWGPSSYRQELLHGAEVYALISRILYYWWVINTAASSILVCSGLAGLLCAAVWPAHQQPGLIARKARHMASEEHQATGIRPGNQALKDPENEQLESRRTCSAASSLRYRLKLPSALMFGPPSI